ncbi:hypothetical protein [Dysgonomonas macrotermitis]|uniref:Uncharacterized protein n=1 Tax=Dysgonomonas macrotermitis TaxID=1346286 RepID=A0A1M4UPD0_9BACT|nr:hypothetical protein [Dysgonomonas macrotermitis]SHE58515.1 hypothetical protein SAMN05444362_101659 [Dysgonomonas macrotermitis]
MNFKKAEDSPFTIGSTQKGNTISFVPISEDKLVFRKELDKPEVLEAIRLYTEKSFEPVPKPTRIILYCNFYIKPSMLDELNSSKIISVIEGSNTKQQIIAEPLNFFDYEKLTDILFDLCKKFDL